MSPPRVWSGSARRAIAFAVVLLAGSAAPATAGTYTATMGLSAAGCAASSYFHAGMTGSANCSMVNQGTGWSIEPSVATVDGGSAGEWQINAPAGLAINSAVLPNVTAIGLASGYGWKAGDYWNGGTSVWP